MDPTRNEDTMRNTMPFWKRMISWQGRSIRVLALLSLLATMVLPFSPGDQTVQLEASSEYSRPDPFGNIVEVDREKSEKRDAIEGAVNTIQLRAARNGYVSFHLMAKLPQGGPYSISVSFQKQADVQVDLLKTWYHLHRADKKYYPDALVPVTNPYRAAIPDTENNILGQTSQAFWVDLWIPSGAKPGIYPGEAKLQSGSKGRSLKIQLQVLQAVIPEEDALIVDHNSYGSSW